MHNILWQRSKTNGCFSGCLSTGNSPGHRCPTRGLTDRCPTKSRKLGNELRLERDMLLFTSRPLTVNLLCSKHCIKYFTHIYSIIHLFFQKYFILLLPTPSPLATISLFSDSMNLFLFCFVCYSVLETSRDGERAG